MKLTIFTLTLVSTIFVSSCGGLSVCDCVKMGEEMLKEIDEAGSDIAKFEEIEKKYKTRGEACEKLREGKSDEEVEKLREEAKACKK